MANYTMTIHEMMNNPLTPIFPKNYPFYCDDLDAKALFEETFILRYLTNEIAYESPYLFQQKLKGRLMEIMPYYQQLYLTEWERVGKDMMNQKDLTDTTIHTLTSTTGSESTLSQNGTNETTQTTSGTASNHHKESLIQNGVASASLNDGYLTGVSEDTAENQSQGSGSSVSTDTSNGSSQTEVILNETTTFHSHGDVGIQTPAYSITEWRKVLININQLIINDCKDLFLKIY